MVYLWIGLAGAAGALSRVWLGRLAVALSTGPSLWATLVINLIGSFVLGFLMGPAIGRKRLLLSLQPPLALGFLGAFTTFSTWAVDSVRLMQAAQWSLVAANLFLSIGLGPFAAWVGFRLASGKPYRHHSST